MLAKKVLYYFIKCVSSLLMVCTFCIFLFFGYIYYCNIVHMDIPKFGPFKIFIVITDSMAPFFNINDAIIIKKTIPENLKINDVITFYAFESDTIITHRIIEKTNTTQGYTFNTKGDNNNVQDSFVTPASRIMGRFIIRIPRFGRFLNTMQSNFYFIAFPILMVILIQALLGYIEKVLKPVKKDSKIGIISMEKEIAAIVNTAVFLEGSDIESEEDIK